MNRFHWIMMLVSVALSSQAQRSDSTKARTYLYYGQPAIEDNSMLIEEAFNQESGAIQHISNVSYHRGNILCSYNQEIPLHGREHQFSFSATYAFQKIAGLSPDQRPVVKSGLGDVLISYRPLWSGKNSRLLVIPRFTLIAPAGNPRDGYGSGGWGGQVGLAATKRISRKIVTHYNVGVSFIPSARYFVYAIDGSPLKTVATDLGSGSLGSSIIWMAKPRLNVMLEYTWTAGKFIENGRAVIKSNFATINPGFRFMFHIEKVEVVPGFGIPLNFQNNNFNSAGALLYLSFEYSR